MKIHFLGAARTVTGSMYLLESAEGKLLLECGLFQGKRKESILRNRSFPFSPYELDGVILSHAHIDHSGNLPNLVKQGYQGPIYATHATAHLAEIMLLDSGYIHEKDAEYLNKKRLKQGKKPIEPLYTQQDAAQAIPLFKKVHYQERFNPLPGVQVHLVDAGHILGSAAVVLDITENGKTSRLWFSGDIGRPGLVLLRDPVLPSDADYLIMESTYGDSKKREPEAAYQELRDVLQRTLQRGGRVIIPAFAVGRTQELVYGLHRMIENGDIPEIPVFLDSPLAIKATEIFREHPECYDTETRRFIAEDRHRSALGFDRLKFTLSVEESKQINFAKPPFVVISASGMAETGRILHHLKNHIEDSRNTVLIVSWQAPHTLGRRLADQEKQIRIFGKRYFRRAEVVTINGFSAHAGQEGLLEYARASQASLKEIFLVHGEPRGADPLREKLLEMGFLSVQYPERGDEFQF